MNVPKKRDASAVAKVKVSGQPIAVDRIINRTALKLELNRPAPEGFVPIIDGVVIDPEGDTYQLPGGARGFSASFLARVQNAAGIQQTETYHREVVVNGEDGIEVEVVAIRPRAGELPLQARAICRMSYVDAYTRYLRRGTDDSEKEKARERSFLPRKLETMAMNRCIAKLAGIKRAERGDLLRTEHGPVVWAFRRDQLDMARDDVRAAYIDAAASSAGRLFGKAAALDDATEGAPLDIASEEHTVRPDDPELGAVSDVEYEDEGEAVWEDVADEPAPEDEPEAEVAEPEDGADGGEDSHSTLFPPAWPYEPDSDISQGILNVNTKRGMWLKVKDLPVSVCNVFLASWSIETEYDAEADEHGVFALWQDSKADAPKRATCKVLMMHFGIEE